MPALSEINEKDTGNDIIPLSKPEPEKKVFRIDLFEKFPFIKKLARLRSFQFFVILEVEFF